MEQLTLLLFIKRLDEAHTGAERKANRTGQPIENSIFTDGTFRPEGKSTGRPCADLRRDRFKHPPAGEMYDVVENYVFPAIRPPDARARRTFRSSASSTTRRPATTTPPA